jgi:hypothetical protein
VMRLCGDSANNSYPLQKTHAWQVAYQCLI